MLHPNLPLLHPPVFSPQAGVDHAAHAILSHIKQTQLAAETDSGHVQSPSASTIVDEGDLQEGVTPNARWSEIYE